MNTGIDFGKVVLKILELLIVKVFVLPVTIYRNALVSLSNAASADSDETLLSPEFPLYTWSLSTFNALIALSYPVGLIAAIYAATNSYVGGFGLFISAIAVTYFMPLWLGLVRELLLLTFKMILYLKVISRK